MTYELEHFKAFQDDPASFSDEDFRAKVLEWMIFIEESGDQFDFEDEIWDDAADRFYDELDRRFPLTPELEAKYAEIKARLVAAHESEDLRGTDAFMKVLRELHEFVRRYQVEFQFSRHYIALTGENLAKIEKARLKAKLCEYDIKGLAYERAQAVIELDEALADYYESTGKTPVTTAHRSVKRHKGN